MTDAAGAIVWTAAFTPFGRDAAITGAATNNNRFPGQYYDLETSLNYNYWRDYDPTTGSPTSDAAGPSNTERASTGTSEATYCLTLTSAGKSCLKCYAELTESRNCVSEIAKQI